MKLFDVYPLFDIEPVRAEGCYLWDTHGRRYLDLYGGHAVISIGHSHPAYVSAITRQLQNIGFYSNSVKMPLQQRVAEKLGELSGYEGYDLFLCNSGAEANENAFKLASFHTGRKKIVAFEGSFHGRTSLAVAATDDPSIQAPVNGTDNVVFCPWNDIAALDAILSTEDIAAVVIEGIQGVGGVKVPGKSFLEAARILCRLYGTLLIVDEIQSGCGRTGRFFAHQHAGIEADIVTMAKGIGNGFPLAGVVIHPDIQARHGLLGTTFGGAYLACAAVLSVLETIEREGLMENAATVGSYIAEKVRSIEGVTEVRGMGLMLGISLRSACAPTRNTLLHEHAVFTGSSADKRTLRILPPLSLTKEQAHVFTDALAQTLASQPASVSLEKAS